MTLKIMGRCLLLSLAILSTPLVHAADNDRVTIRIGWTAWSDAEFMTRLVARIIEQRTDHEVELTLVDIALQYQGVARGDLDVMLMAWLPDTHRDYYQRFGLELVDLGPIYTGARLGWVVPDYVPESQLSSIADLKKPEIASRLRRQIYGIDPGAGLMQLSERAMAAYGLEDWNLIGSSGAAMTAMVGRAYRRQDWIVATAWSPHWMFHEWKLRYLDDPERVLGGREHVHALVRKNFYRDVPDVFRFLSRLYIPLEELEAAISHANNTDYETAVDHYIDNHPARIHYWLTGEPGRLSDPGR